MGRLDLAIEQKVLRALKGLGKERIPRRVLLALSGGADSMVLAEILWKWKVGLGLELFVAHVHHGVSANPEQNDYRAEARELVRAWARERRLKFVTNLRSPELSSEAEFREFRDSCLRRWKRELRCDAVAFAHHRDDLLETRLIRLIRGSGGQGLRSMSPISGDKFRPLLTLSGREIRDYAGARKLKWCEDPSNLSLDFLRNWVRREWLPSLESQRPGAVTALARSLETLVPASREFDLAPFVGLRRDLLLNVSTLERKSLVAQYLKALGLKGYARTHVEEILKRLDTDQKKVSFDMLGLRFTITSDFLTASRV